METACGKAKRHPRRRLGTQSLKRRQGEGGGGVLSAVCERGLWLWFGETDPGLVSSCFRGAAKACLRGTPAPQSRSGPRTTRVCPGASPPSPASGMVRQHLHPMARGPPSSTPGPPCTPRRARPDCGGLCLKPTPPSHPWAGAWPCDLRWVHGALPVQEA